MSDQKSVNDADDVGTTLGGASRSRRVDGVRRVPELADGGATPSSLCAIVRNSYATSGRSPFTTALVAAVRATCVAHSPGPLGPIAVRPCSSRYASP